MTCTIYYLILVLEHGNELWSVFHYSPSGAIAHFVQQFLVIFGLMVTVLFYAAILYRVKAAAATTQERIILKIRGDVERVRHDGFRHREVRVFISA